MYRVFIAASNYCWMCVIVCYVMSATWMSFERCLMLSTAAVSGAHCHHRPATLGVERTTSVDLPLQSSLVSVADHVEHLTDTAMGRCFSQ